MQQFQIQLPGAPQSQNPNTPAGARTASAYYGGPSGVRASVACDACRKRKVKCTAVVHPHPSAGQEPPPRMCVRCSRLGIECSWKDEKKGGKQPRSLKSPASAQGLEVVFETYPNQLSIGYVILLVTPQTLFAFIDSYRTLGAHMTLSFLN